jgi:PHD/YefM family antitoxin component YafN of YafNO toxin-antitoxin module
MRELYQMYNYGDMSPHHDSPPLSNTSDNAADQRLPHVLGRDGKPEAVVIPYASYRRLQEAQKDKILALFDRLLERLGEQNAACTEEEIAVDVEKARGG